MIASQVLLRNSKTGGLEVYDIANNQLTGVAALLPILRLYRARSRICRTIKSSYRAHRNQISRAAPQGVEQCGQAPSVVRSRGTRAERAGRLAYVTC
jgi:hypothetical protein